MSLLTKVSPALAPGATGETTTATAIDSTTPLVESTAAAPPKRRPNKNTKAELVDAHLMNVWPRPYIIEDGLRRLEPYDYTYNTWVKQRWRGRELLDVFESEFRDRPLAYYKAAMESGKICVNGKPAKPDQVLKNGDLVSHRMHRHEPPVTGDPIEILHEDDDMIVINKPSGIPVHPAGRYNWNSVVEIMKVGRGRDFLAYPCNRLDRLTSGIMFVAKNARAAEQLSSQIMKRGVRKEYLARVIGDFPDGEIVCNEPVLQISPKLGLNRVRANGKDARTVFKKLAYYSPPEPSRNFPEALDRKSQDLGGNQGQPWKDKSGYSIVRCLPVTGRTHQIRVHLQHLGHPIENDPIYANQRVWGLKLGFNDPEGVENTDDDIVTRLSRMGKSEVADAVAYHDEMVDEYYKKKAERMSGELCKVCDTPLYTDPGEQELSLWLHSLRYEDAGGAWSYVSPLPRWALPPSGTKGPTAVGSLDDLIEAVRDTNPEIL